MLFAFPHLRACSRSRVQATPLMKKEFRERTMLAGSHAAPSRLARRRPGRAGEAHAGRIRARAADTRGVDIRKPELNEAFVVSPPRGTDLAALDDDLTTLAAMEGRKAKVIDLRFFGRLSAEETAEVSNVSPGTVMRDWRLARVGLWHELKRGADHDET